MVSGARTLGCLRKGRTEGWREERREGWGFVKSATGTGGREGKKRKCSLNFLSCLRYCVSLKKTVA